jgi:hypothetical protein
MKKNVMAKIKLNVEMRSGTGFGVWVTVDGKSYQFTQTDSKNITLTPEFYVATVGGHEPTTAKVIISFLQDQNELAKEEYTDPTFFGFIPFEVK